MRPKVEWAIDSEVMRAKGITVLVKSNWFVKRISRQNIFHYLKLDFNPFLPPKHDKYDGSFSVLEGSNKQPTCSSANQNAALIIDH